jgi:hypothetical protein
LVIWAFVVASGQKLEAGGVGGTDDREVPPVKCCDLGDVETLGRSDHRCVNRSEGKIPILADQFGDPKPVTGHHRLDSELPSGEIAEETDLGICTKPTPDEVDDLGDDESRDDQGTRVGEQQVKRLAVVAVVGIDVGVERSSIDQGGYLATSAARISSIRSEMSSRPLCPAPAARR